MTGGLANLHEPAQHGCYAHFPGTGPFGECCRRCHWFKRGYPLIETEAGEKIPDHGYCKMYKKLRPMERRSRIPAEAAACRYFELKDGSET